MSKKVLAAIIGRPNVGKSSLFNALLRAKKAITFDEKGTTRDTLIARMRVGERELLIADTAGLSFDFTNDEVIEQEALQQTKQAIANAEIIIFVVEAGGVLTNEDQKIAAMLRKAQVKVLLVVNKSERESIARENFNFHRLGLGEFIAVSALRNQNIAILRTKLFELVAATPDKKVLTNITNTPKIAFLGAPNVGKSSLFNTIFGTKKVTVSNIAGTTRDAINSHIKYANQEYTFIDTAGLKRNGNMARGIDKFSALRTVLAVESADIIILTIDGSNKINRQDQRLADLAIQAHKGVILAINKWDLVGEKFKDPEYSYLKHLQKNLGFLNFAPIIFTSAKTGLNVSELFQIIDRIWRDFRHQINPEDLNIMLEKALIKQAPVNTKVRRQPRIISIEQVRSAPPTIEVMVSNDDLIHTSWKRFLRTFLLQELQLYGTNIRLNFKTKQRTKKII